MRRRGRRAVKETAGVTIARVWTQAPDQAAGVAPLRAREAKEAAKVAVVVPRAAAEAVKDMEKEAGVGLPRGRLQGPSGFVVTGRQATASTPSHVGLLTPGRFGLIPTGPRIVIIREASPVAKEERAVVDGLRKGVPALTRVNRAVTNGDLLRLFARTTPRARGRA